MSDAQTERGGRPLPASPAARQRVAASCTSSAATRGAVGRGVVIADDCAGAAGAGVAPYDPIDVDTSQGLERRAWSTGWAPTIWAATS